MMGGLMKSEMFSVNSRYPEVSDETLASINQQVKKNLPQYDLDSSWVLTKPIQGNTCKYEWKW